MRPTMVKISIIVGWATPAPEPDGLYIYNQWCIRRWWVTHLHCIIFASARLSPLPLFAVSQFSLHPAPWQLQYSSWVPPCELSRVSHLNLRLPWWWCHHDDIIIIRSSYSNLRRYGGSRAVKPQTVGIKHVRTNKMDIASINVNINIAFTTNQQLMISFKPIDLMMICWSHRSLHGVDVHPRSMMMMTMTMTMTMMMMMIGSSFFWGSGLFC